MIFEECSRRERRLILASAQDSRRAETVRWLVVSATLLLIGSILYFLSLFNMQVAFLLAAACFVETFVLFFVAMGRYRRLVGKLAWRRDEFGYMRIRQPEQDSV